MTAFDGAGPFDGDAVYNYLDQVRRPPVTFREAVANAFREVIEGGAARRMPAELLAMAGLEGPVVYLDVDEAVWAWACAEIVAVALGHEPETPIPDLFAQAARTMPNPGGLVRAAREALQLVSDPERSELAGLLQEANNQAPFQRMARLRLFLTARDSL